MPPPILPADVLRWVLTHHPNAGAPFLAAAEAYRQYAAVLDRPGHYLWRQYDARLAELGPLLTPDARVLEVGSGYGIDLAWAALSGAETTGIEVKSEFADAALSLAPAIAAAHGRTARLQVLRSNLLDHPEDAPYDVVYMKEAFHHLEPRADVVAKLARLLRPGGHLVILEPNAWNPAIQWRMFRVRGLRTVITKTDAATGERFVYGNERIVTGLAITRAFARAGVRGRARYHRLVPTGLALAGRDRLLRALEPAVERLLPWPLCIHCTWHGQRAG